MKVVTFSLLDERNLHLPPGPKKKKIYIYFKCNLCVRVGSIVREQERERNEMILTRFTCSQKPLSNRNISNNPVASRDSSTPRALWKEAAARRRRGGGARRAGREVATNPLRPNNPLRGRTKNRRRVTFVQQQRAQRRGDL